MSARIKGIFIVLFGLAFIWAIFWSINFGKQLKASMGVAHAAPVIKLAVPLNPAVVEVPELKPTGGEKQKVEPVHIKPDFHKIKYDEVGWVALNMYHEARGEGPVGMLAVGEVTIHRVKSSKYPNTIYSVISQPHQFSWYIDGRPNRPTDAAAYYEAVSLAERVVIGGVDLIDDNVLHYHANHVTPKWADTSKLYAQIGSHKYYNL